MSQNELMPSLLISSPSVGHRHLIVGSNNSAVSRCMQSLEIGALPVLLSPTEPENIIPGVRVIQKVFEECDLMAWGREENLGYVDLVFCTENDTSLEREIFLACRRHRIPVNVADNPSLSTFTLLSSYHDGPFQLGVSTSGLDCRLANRIKREIVSRIPPRLGNACSLLGYFRKELLAEDEQCRLNDICEFWPLNDICNLKSVDIETMLQHYPLAPFFNSHIKGRKSGQIALVGSGPGDPKLLTVAAVEAINSADVVLADKLVPQSILEHIPKGSSIHIARKFPGNSANGQQELLDLGLDALRKGQNVIRLKQGDPYIFGRAGEEVSFFEANGFKPTVIPGITSALSAGIFSAVPLTVRGVSDQVLITTGTGEKGAVPEVPEYVASRTSVFLMALHRLDVVVANLIQKGWPQDLACTVVERASCRDQRVVRTRLKHVVGAMKVLGGRPPGLLIVGKSCERLRKWQGKWVVEEGFDGFQNSTELINENCGKGELPDEKMKHIKQFLQLQEHGVV